MRTIKSLSVFIAAIVVSFAAGKWQANTQRNDELIKRGEAMYALDARTGKIRLERKQQAVIPIVTPAPVVNMTPNPAVVTP